MRTRGLSKYSNSQVPSTFKLQITSMVDVFIILLVFLLKSFSTSPVQINPPENLKLPESTASADPVDVIKVIVSKSGIAVEENAVLEFIQGTLGSKDLDASDSDFIPKLFAELDKHAERSKEISKVNSEAAFDGRILVQADKEMPYEILRKVMYTSMLVGYSDVKLAVLSK